MVDKKICPSCLTCENIREELIENCGAQLNIFICCCETIITTMEIGGPVTVLEVGSDKVTVATGTAPFFTSQLIIPLNRIAGFIELAPPLTEGNCDCGTRKNFVEELADLCGQIVAVQACFCGEINAFLGPPDFTLVEVSPSFVELRNTSTMLQRVDDFADVLPGQDLIIPIENVCYVQSLLTVPTTCPPCTAG